MSKLNKSFMIFMGRAEGSVFNNWNNYVICDYKDYTQPIHTAWPPYLRCGGHDKVMVF